MKGKTNWNYIIIVLILAVIVGGGILVCQQWFPKFIELPISKKPLTSKEFTLGLNEEAKIIFHERYPERIIVHEYYISLENINISLNTVRINAEQFVKDYKPVSELKLGDVIISFVTEEGGAKIKLINIKEDEATFETWFEIGPPHLRGPFPPKEIIITKKETADWKTYRNEEYSYEMKYPKEWFVEAENISDDLRQIYVTRFFISEEKTKPIVVIHIYDSQNLSLSEWLDFYTNYTGNKVINKEPILIPSLEGNIEGIKGDHLAGDQLYKGIFLLKGNKIYNMNLIPKLYREFTAEELEIFNQILSTFRFLE